MPRYDVRRFLVQAILLWPLMAAAENAQLNPSFPNYALAVVPAGTEGRSTPAGPVDTEPPFSWPQVIVTREGAQQGRFVGAFDPQLQSLNFEIQTSTPMFLRVLAFNSQTGGIDVKIDPKTGGNSDTFLFKVRARGLSNEQLYPLTFDIRSVRTRIRGTPALARSLGDFVAPGNMVRYLWTRTGRGEKRPKVEALLVGETGPAKGLTTSTLTELLSLKVRPVVLGHYLMTVTPRDVRGEPARGSTSNGVVFRCAFGSDNLPPVTDGFMADTFTPAAGQSITLAPVATDPQTGRTSFNNQTYDFGDGTVLSGVNGPATHAFALPGIYTLRCTLLGDSGLGSTAQDNMIVAPILTPNVSLQYNKKIVPSEAGAGELQSDTLSVNFKGANAGPNDRIVFVFNRNRFGKMNPSDLGDDTDIVLKNGTFSGPTRLAKNIVVTARAGNLGLDVVSAQFDRTGDPRLGRADLKGIFKNQRIALCVVPQDGSTPHVLLYSGNVDLKLKGGQIETGSFIPEESVFGKSTLKEPDPRKQEIP